MTGYNLIDKPWIDVVDDQGESHKWGIRKVLHEAGRIRLAAYSEEYRIPLLRLLLSLTYRILTTSSERLKPEKMWLDLYKQDGFAPDLVDRYLDRWASRFDLFDRQNPFMQTPGLTTAKKPTPLQQADPIARGVAPFTSSVMPDRGFSPSDAALMILAIQAWDIAGIKTAAQGSPSAKLGKEYAPRGLPSTGLCGLMDMAWLEGPDLYHTLILGWIPNFSGPDDTPIWELDTPPGPAPVMGRKPTGPADCLTWPSRRILLQGGINGVTGATVTYGDIIDPLSMHGIEPMACWIHDKHLLSRYRPQSMNHHQPLAAWLTNILPIPSTTDPDLCPAALSWVARNLPVVGADLGLSLHTSSMRYSTQSSIITKLETYKNPIIPDWMTTIGATILKRVSIGLLEINSAWTSYRVAMMVAAGGNLKHNRTRQNAVKDQAADQIQGIIDKTLSPILAGKANPIQALNEAVTEVKEQITPDQPPNFIPHSGISPAWAQQTLDNRLTNAILGQHLTNLTDTAKAIAHEQTHREQTAKKAMQDGWPASQLAHAYGKSVATLKKLRDRDHSNNNKMPSTDPRGNIVDTRARIQVLSNLLCDLWKVAQGFGVSTYRIEQATGVNAITLLRQISSKNIKGYANDGNPLWQIWMPKDTWIDRYTPRAVTWGVLSLTSSAINEEQMEHLLQVWCKQPRIFKDRVTGLRILPHVELEIHPQPKTDNDQMQQANAQDRRRKLTEKDDAEILRLYQSKTATVKELAAKYAVSVPTIYNALRRSK